jgi:predicted ATPase
MLTRASFRNFKNLREVDVDLDRFTVLVGPNGAGKTSVLQGIHLLTQLGLGPRRAAANLLDDSPGGHLGRLFSGRWKPGRLVTSGQNYFRLALAEQDTHGASAEAVVLEVQPSPESGDDNFLIELPGEPGGPISWGASRTGDPEVLASRRLQRLRAAVYLHLDAAIMVRPSVVEHEVPRLAHDGAGLASVLAYLAGTHPDRKEAIEADVAAIVPWFKRVLVRNTKVPRLTTRPFAVGREAVNVPVEEEVWGHRFAVEITDGSTIPADLLSEGTVLVLGLMTMLHGPTAPRLLLLDDLDRGLHLGAQVRLVHALQKLLVGRPDLQLVATSHSPYLLQEMPASSVRVLGLSAGGVRCQPLTSHPDYEKWKAVLGTGEIWANLGEDWLGDAG